MIVRIAAWLLWLFGPLAVWLQQEFLGNTWLLLLVALLWTTAMATGFEALRPRWMPEILAYPAGFLAGGLLLAGEIFLPNIASLVLAVVWIPVGLRVHMEHFARQERI